MPPGAFGRWRPPEGCCSRRIELGEGRAQRVKTRRVGEVALLDGAPDQRRHCGVWSIVGMGGLLRGAGAVTADPLTGLGAHGVGRGAAL
jgi:hypothetical protein